MSDWYGQDRTRRREENCIRTTRPPVLLEFRSSKRFILGAASLAVFTDLFLYCVIVPAIPFTLSDRIGVPKDQVQYWTSIQLAIYGASLLASSPIVGIVADRTQSRRWPYLFGLVALTGGSLMLCLGTNLAWLLFGRVLQGAASSMVWIVGLALVVDTYRSEETGQALGVMVICWTLALFVGPMIGGILYERSGYYSVFSVSFVLIAIDIIWRLAIIEQKAAKRWLDEDGRRRSSDADVVGGRATSKICVQCGHCSQQTLVTPAEVEKPFARSAPMPLESLQTGPRALHPLSQAGGGVKSRSALLHLLRSRRFVSGVWAAFVNATTLTSFDAVLPLQVNHYFGWTSLGAGLIFLAIVVPTGLSPLIGRYFDRHTGERWSIRAITTGCFLFTLPCLVLMRFVDGDPGTGNASHVVLLCALLGLLGLAQVTVSIVATTEMTGTVAARERSRPGIYGPRGGYAQAYALYNIAFGAGSMVGPVMTGLLRERFGWPVACLALGLVNAVSAIPAFLFTGGTLWKQEQEQPEDSERRQSPSPRRRFSTAARDTARLEGAADASGARDLWANFDSVQRVHFQASQDGPPPKA